MSKQKYGSRPTQCPVFRNILLKSYVTYHAFLIQFADSLLLKSFLTDDFLIQFVYHLLQFYRKNDSLTHLHTTIFFESSKIDYILLKYSIFHVLFLLTLTCWHSCSSFSWCHLTYRSHLLLLVTKSPCFLLLKKWRTQTASLWNQFIKML